MTLGFLIALDVRGKFLLPELDVASRCAGSWATWVSVPEATVNKNDCSPFRQNNIRFSWKILGMQAKPEAKAVEYFSDGEFRLSVGVLDATHHLRTLFRAYVVHTTTPK